MNIMWKKFKSVLENLLKVARTGHDYFSNLSFSKREVIPIFRKFVVKT